jgi:hypothetical protein
MMMSSGLSADVALPSPACGVELLEAGALPVSCAAAGIAIAKPDKATVASRNTFIVNLSLFAHRLLRLTRIKYPRIWDTFLALDLTRVNYSIVAVRLIFARRDDIPHKK